MPISLLRYPGGKTRAITEITKYFPKNISEMCSPFFGGGSIELTMAKNGIKVYGYDLFEPLVNFWQCVKNNPKKLANEIEKFYPLSKNKFYELQKLKIKSKIKSAAVFYVLNRSSFSGTTGSGGMSPGHPRFTLSSIERVRNFSLDNCYIECANFETSLLKHKNIFKYLDPPYLIQSPLYGKNGNIHKGFNHELLFNIISKQNNWIMSYNNCDEIKSLYKNFQIIFPEWKYCMSKNKTSSEVLIFSKDFLII